MNGPNFILIGVQKSGTTSLYNWLGQHPDVYANELIKDYNYFCNDELLSLSRDYFGRFFKNVSDERILMHGFPNYIYFYKNSAANIYKFNKNIKLLLILRNPIERAYSAYWEAKKTALEDSKSFEEALSRESSYIVNGNMKEKGALTYVDHGYYSRQIEGYYKYFSKEQIKIIFFEDLKRNPDKTVGQVFSFMNIDNKFKPNFSIKNSSALPRSVVMQRIFQSLTMPKFIKPFVPPSVSSKIKISLIRKLNVKPFQYAQMKQETRNFLVSTFKDDIKRLEKILDVDLSHWQ